MDEEEKTRNVFYGKVPRKKTKDLVKKARKQIRKPIPRPTGEALLRRREIERKATQRSREKKRLEKHLNTKTAKEIETKMKKYLYLEGDDNQQRLKCVEDFVNKLLKNQDRDYWVGMLCRRLRVKTVVEFISDHQCMRLKETRGATEIAVEQETNREWIIQFYDEYRVEWFDWFKVATSNIEGAGFGLFAKRPFPVGSVLGVYFGELLDKKEEEKIRSVYKLSCLWNKRWRVMDAINGPERTEKFKAPAWFALHMVNDPGYIGYPYENVNKKNEQCKQGRRNPTSASELI